MFELMFYIPVNKLSVMLEHRINFDTLWQQRKWSFAASVMFLYIDTTVDKICIKSYFFCLEKIFEKKYVCLPYLKFSDRTLEKHIFFFIWS